MEEEKSDKDDGNCGATRDDLKIEKEEIEFGGVPLHYTREMRSILASISRFNVHYVNILEEPVQFRRQCSSYGDVLSHANYDAHCKVLT